MKHRSIEDQTRLPLNVALQVVLQGLKIRFGRSVVTIMGVVLGIAFLMSILTTQILKQGVANEESIRLELSRMGNFLTAEIGPASGKVVGILQTSPLSETEQRFLAQLKRDGVSGFSWHTLAGDTEDLGSDLEALVQPVELEQALSEPRVVLLTGDGTIPETVWQQAGRAPSPVTFATTRHIAERRIPEAASVTTLAQELRPEEVDRMKAKQRTDRFRNTWIIIISLLVTVIGISNAMLMSVTERFREIGTMKCLGALSAFVRQIFVFESCLIGAVGGILGGLIGALFAIVAYGFTFGFGIVMRSTATGGGTLLLYGVLAFVAGIVLSMVAAIYPAQVASRMVPADALRSNV